jgi:hypothetical protein
MDDPIEQFDAQYAQAYEEEDADHMLATGMSYSLSSNRHLPMSVPLAQGSFQPSLHDGRGQYLQPNPVQDNSLPPSKDVEPALPTSGKGTRLVPVSQLRAFILAIVFVIIV